MTGEAQLETFLRDHCLGSTDPTTVTKELQETVDTLNKIATKDKGQKVGLHVDNYCWFSLIGNNYAVLAKWLVESYISVCTVNI